MPQAPNIYVINLDRSPDRLAYMRQHLDSFGLTFERIEAIDGKMMSEAQKQLHRRSAPSLDSGEMLSDTHIAINLSHLKALQAFLDSPADHALILEDDAELTDTALEVIAEVLRRAAEWPRFDGLELSGWGNSSQWIVPEMTHAGITIGRSKKFLPGAAATLYSRQGARKVIASAIPMRTYWDGYLALGWFHGARFLTARPFPARQLDEVQSTYAGNPPPSVNERSVWWRARRALYRLHQGPRKFFSDLAWMGPSAVLQQSKTCVRAPANAPLPPLSQSAPSLQDTP